jgi:hypothetical protein
VLCCTTFSAAASSAGSGRLGWCFLLELLTSVRRTGTYANSQGWKADMAPPSPRTTPRSQLRLTRVDRTHAAQDDVHILSMGPLARQP